jgi:hypothetical protein
MRAGYQFAHGALLAMIVVLGAAPHSYGQTAHSTTLSGAAQGAVEVESQSSVPATTPAASGSISGTVTDENGDLIPGATIVLHGGFLGSGRTLSANDNGLFTFAKLSPGVEYRITVSAPGFVDWTSGLPRLEPGQHIDLKNVILKVDGGPITVTVSASQNEIAAAQVHVAERQRALGFIPNFLVVYDHNPAPLTPKLKFQLAFRIAVDPVTFIGVAGLAGVNQAAHAPDYVEGVKGYGQRVGALYADGFTDLMLGGAVLPTLLHQDPRYFYQGTGSTKSRTFHALLSPFITRGDNGSEQPNYSSLGGDLASTAIAETYYPASNRGPRLVFANFAIGTGERMVSAFAQEFILRKLTPNAAKNSN